jgi:transcription-repair coupling factor (superfamily II helicase)
MSLSEHLLPPIIQSPTFQRLLNRVRSYEDEPNLGLARAARLAVTAAFYHSLGVPILLVTDRADHALTLVDELGMWVEQAPRQYFPEPTPLFYESSPWNETTRRDRLQTLTALAAYHIPGVLPRPQDTQPDVENLSRLEARRIIWEGIRSAQDVEGSRPPIIVASVRALMSRTLPRRNFIKNTRNLRQGQQVQPTLLVRNWVQMGYEAVDTVVVPGQFARRGGLIDVWPPAAAQPVRIDFFGDEVDTLRYFDPATQLSSGSVERLLISLVLIDDLDAVTQMADDVETQAVELRAEKIEDGHLPPDFPVAYTPWSELYDALSYRRTLQLGPSGGMDKSELARMFSPNPRFGGRIKAVTDHLKHQIHRQDQPLLVSRQSARLKELWRQEASPDLTPAPIFLSGSLAEGFVFAPPGENRLHVLADGEIFGWRRPQVRKRPHVAGETPEVAYADLQVGDWVVHIDHGIGRYMGLVQRTIDRIEREYLSVEYDDGDQLYVPVHQADRLTRYIGPDGRTPTATRLGSNQWKQARDRVKKAVEDVADDLLELYSKRHVIQGYAFSPDSDWQRELEASFPYEETEDQSRVITEVKRDMESPHPMDRLICGDVGYGKTEVALRAAFKAVYDGKQVAMLVPTTVPG